MVMEMVLSTMAAAAAAAVTLLEQVAAAGSSVSLFASPTRTPISTPEGGAVVTAERVATVEMELPVQAGTVETVGTVVAAVAVVG